MELGARYNGFSLSEQSPTVAAAIERVGQAADTSYIETEELSSSLSANFAEPMRETSQFASVVRGVLRYRVLKRVQQEMTLDELAKKRTLLQSLERSEQEAQRIDQFLNRSQSSAAGGSTSAPSTPSDTPGEGADSGDGRPSSSSNAAGSGGAGGAGGEDTASIDSDFPPTHGESIGTAPGASQGTTPRRQEYTAPSSTIAAHRKTSSGTFVANKIFGRISHAVHGFVDVDPERTRRDQIGKTKESLSQVCWHYLVIPYSPALCSCLGTNMEVYLTLRFTVGASAGGFGEGRQRCEHRGIAGPQAVPAGQRGGLEAIHGESPFFQFAHGLRGHRFPLYNETMLNSGLGGLRAVSSRLGTEESGDMDGSQRRGRQDRRAMNGKYYGIARD